MADEILELADEAIRRVEDGDPSDALGLAERAVALAADDPRPAARAAAHRAMGRVHFGLGDFRAAVVDADRALALDLEADPGSAEVGEDDNLAGTAALALGDASTALERIRTAFERLERTLGPDDEKTIRALNNVAAATARSGDEVAAEAIGRDALARAERALGTHRQTAVVLNSLSVRAGRSRDRLREAVELAERGREIAERALGPSHPLAATLAANAAINHAKAGDDGAEQLIRDSVARHEQAYGPTHPNLAFVLVALSDITSDPHEKRTAIARATLVRLRALGPTAQPTLDALARTVARLAPREAGDAVSADAIDIYRAWAALDPKRAPTPIPFGGERPLDEIAERLDAALTRVLTDVPLADAVRAEVSEDFARADAAVAADDYEAAVAALRHATVVVETAKGPGSPDVLEPLRRLESVARTAGDDELRFEVVTRIADVTTGAYGSGHPLSALALQRYAERERYEYGDVSEATAARAIDAVRLAFGEGSPVLDTATRVWQTGRRPRRAVPISRRRREELERIAGRPSVPALEGLDAVDWNAVHHAYGRARDTPNELRLLGSPDPDVRADAVARIAGSLVHQGSLYTATAAAAPLLVRLALEPGTPDRAGIVGLLAYAVDAARSPGASDVEAARGVLRAVEAEHDRLVTLDDGTPELTSAVGLLRQALRAAPRVRRLN